MKKIGYSLLVGIALFAFSCEETEPLSDCNTDLICTEIFQTIIFSPVDQNDNAIRLDRYYSQNLDNGNTYDYQATDLAQSSEVYVVITDAEINQVQSTGTTIRFFGEADGNIVIEQDFVIGHDCCHVMVLDGPASAN